MKKVKFCHSDEILYCFEKETKKHWWECSKCGTIFSIPKLKEVRK
ncbi:MAG: hypothetical protein ACFFCW_19995 [Candidatus Hodarchaeota archaeon]